MSQPASTPSSGVLPVDRIVRPRSIAIVGASADPRSFGGFVQGNLERFGYDGALHLVSRSSNEIQGRPCVKTIDALPEGIDLAVLAIPEAGVLDAVKALAARRCHAAVLFASGYAEAGEDGQARQQALADAARAAGILLVGPNCMGFTNLAAGVPVTFEPLAAREREQRPGVGVVAQSGFMAANLRDAFLGRGVPVTSVFSTGNEVSVSVEDVLAHYIGDVQTRVIAADERMGIVWLRMAWGVRERGGDQLTVWEMFKVYDGQIHMVEAYIRLANAVAARRTSAASAARSTCRTRVRSSAT